MNSQHRPAAVGFHSGELAAQRQAGVQAEAARLARMVGPAELRGGTAAFLADARFAALTARDGAGRLWTSPLLAAPGFLQASGPNTLRIGTTLPADPSTLPKRTIARRVEPARAPSDTDACRPWTYISATASLRALSEREPRSSACG